mgnify:CR=1 FL=1
MHPRHIALSLLSTVALLGPTAAFADKAAAIQAKAQNYAVRLGGVIANRSKATDEIDRQTRARILIIEDEPIIAMDIEMIVRDLGHDVVAVATTHREAVAEAQKHQPGLVLADIQLADNSSGI